MFDLPEYGPGTRVVLHESDITGQTKPVIEQLVDNEQEGMIDSDEGIEKGEE